MKAPAATEHQIHCAIVALLNARARESVIWFHPANGEARSAITGARLKRMGVKKGVPDLVFVFREGGALFMEIKREGARLSPEQREMESRCYDQDIPYEVVHSLEEAIGVFEDWGVI